MLSRNKTLKGVYFHVNVQQKLPNFPQRCLGTLINAQVGPDGLKTDAGLLDASSHFSPKNQTKGKKKMAASLIFIWNGAIFHTPFTFYTGSVLLGANVQTANVCICLHRFAPLNCPAPLKKKMTLPTTITPCRKWLTNPAPCSQLQFHTVRRNDCFITLHGEMCTGRLYSCRRSALA